MGKDFFSFPFCRTKCNTWKLCHRTVFPHDTTSRPFAEVDMCFPEVSVLHNGAPTHDTLWKDGTGTKHVEGGSSRGKRTAGLRGTISGCVVTAGPHNTARQPARLGSTQPGANGSDHDVRRPRGQGAFSPTRASVEPRSPPRGGFSWEENPMWWRLVMG